MGILVDVTGVFFPENPVFYTLKLSDGKICETKVAPYVPS